MRIYVDLDDTLVASIIDPFSGVVRKTYARPEAADFLNSLSSYGQVTLLTRAYSDHVGQALQKLGDAAGLIKKVVPMERLLPVEERVGAILQSPISDRSKLDLLSKIKPILPRGFIFDDQPVGSDAYFVKTRATGAHEYDWVQVEPFDLEVPDMGGLRRAFEKWEERLRPQALRGTLA